MGESLDTLIEWSKEQRERGKEKRKSNLEYSTALLIEKEVEFQSCNNGLHLIIETENGTFDFWPSTGKFRNRKSPKHGRGVKNLLKALGVA